MLPGELKPILTALLLPPLAPLLLAVFGLLLVWGRRRFSGSLFLVLGLGSLWLLSCQAVALVMSAALLPAPPPARPEQLKDVQAIVVLGGGIVPLAPEYGSAQPNSFTLGRLRYAAWLAARTGKPLAFAGGVGWSAAGTDVPPEAEAAASAVADFGARLQWVDTVSRDTAENAAEMRNLLPPEVRRIALVTDAWHQVRAIAEFQAAGFEVVPAPTGYPSVAVRPLLTWLPSADGLVHSRHVLREVLGLAAMRVSR